MDFVDYFESNRGLPINKWLHYLPIYERCFAPYRGKPLVFLEIGTGQGGSSRMWTDYFGPDAKVISIDIRPECAKFQNDRIAVRIGNQADPVFLQSLIDEFGAPDIVLDDGCHFMAAVNASFDYLYPRMPTSALYVVEDMHTAYWPAWGGGLRLESTFIERMKRLVDELHADNPHNAAQAAQEIPSSEIARITGCVTFYPSIVVVEKAAYTPKKERSVPFVAGQTIW